MSSNLRAEPVSRKKLELGTALKFSLRKAYSEPINIVMTQGDLPFLRGMMFSGNEEIQKDVHNLMTFINTHGSVLVKEEY